MVSDPVHPTFGSRDIPGNWPRRGALRTFSSLASVSSPPAPCPKPPETRTRRGSDSCVSSYLSSSSRVFWSPHRKRLFDYQVSIPAGHRTGRASDWSPLDSFSPYSQFLPEVSIASYCWLFCLVVSLARPIFFDTPRSGAADENPGAIGCSRSDVCSRATGISAILIPRLRSELLLGDCYHANSA